MEKERRCRKCGTVLSTYNSNPGLCFLHARIALEAGSTQVQARGKVRNVLSREESENDFRTNINALDEEFLASVKGLPKTERILRIVAKAYGIDVGSIISNIRVREVSWARYVAMHLLDLEFGRGSYKKVAMLTSSTVQTVKHGLRMVRSSMDGSGGGIRDTIEKIQDICSN